MCSVGESTWPGWLDAMSVNRAWIMLHVQGLNMVSRDRKLIQFFVYFSTYIHTKSTSTYYITYTLFWVTYCTEYQLMLVYI